MVAPNPRGATLSSWPGLGGHGLSALQEGFPPSLFSSHCGMSHRHIHRQGHPLCSIKGGLQEWQGTLGVGVLSTGCLIEISIGRATHPNKHCCIGGILPQRLPGEGGVTMRCERDWMLEKGAAVLSLCDHSCYSSEVGSGRPELKQGPRVHL